jgi:hypothetical protein
MAKLPATSARKKEQSVQIQRIVRPRAATALEEQLLELQSLCGTLLQIAQKYTPDTPQAYVDAAAVAQCGRQLEHIGVHIPAAAHFAAATAATNKGDMVICSPEYRYLRNKAIAGFATIADLGAKNPVVGTHDFIAGLRDGYKRASTLAVAFLDDIYFAH